MRLGLTFPQKQDKNKMDVHDKSKSHDQDGGHIKIPRYLYYFSLPLKSSFNIGLSMKHIKNYSTSVH